MIEDCYQLQTKNQNIYIRSLLWRGHPHNANVDKIDFNTEYDYDYSYEDELEEPKPVLIQQTNPVESIDQIGAQQHIITDVIDNSNTDQAAF